jgi:hypothetical protein
MAKEKTPRCNFLTCRKKITVIDTLMSLCKCGKMHCMNHRFPECHNCTFDFRKDVDRETAIEKIKCVAPKLTNVIF